MEREGVREMEEEEKDGQTVSISVMNHPAFDFHLYEASTKITSPPPPAVSCVASLQFLLSAKTQFDYICISLACVCI